MDALAKPQNTMPENATLQNVMPQSEPPRSLVGALPPVEEVQASTLLDTLAGHTDKSLIFHYEGRDVRASYHVTEVKTGAFRGLDCGAQAEHWNETFIQLWDIEEDNRVYMTAGKFLAIIGKVGAAVGFDADAKLTFEVSDGVRPMQIYRAERIDAADAVRVYLSARPSSCKPRDRWLAQEMSQAAGASCCAPKAAKPCCG